MPWRNDATPRNTMKPNATKTANNAAPSGVLAGQHKGGNSDVANMQTKLTSYGLNPDTKFNSTKPGTDISPLEMAYRKKMSAPQPAAKPASPAQRTESKLMTQQKGKF